MPFGPLMSPSIALSLLKASLTRHGIASRVDYFSLLFASRIGERLYTSIATDSGQPAIRELAGEWIFSGALQEQTLEEEERYVEEILRQRGAWSRDSRMPPLSERTIARIRRARALAPRFLDRCAELLLRHAPRVVGFTSVFQQNVASLALARRIKAIDPDVFIVFGGANCEGAMGAELVRHYPFVDAVVSGEAEVVFPLLVSRVLRGEPFSDLAGVRTKESDGPITTALGVAKMDDLPEPDYGDFFAQFEASKFADEWQPSLFFESSRGCWWGEKAHCTFCGLNGSTMKFRSKSPPRAIDELERLVKRYPECDIQVTDNILDTDYFETFVPELARRSFTATLFYETKSNLTREQIRKLRDASILRIQPGIESLDDGVLRLMRKGVTALQNIQLLKWCKELGVIPYWNFLWGFPGEEPDAYRRMADFAPSLVHLPPPIGSAGIRLDRFSPNFNDPTRFGFANVRPLAPYRHLYAVPDEALGEIAYYFSFDYAQPQRPSEYVGPLLAAIETWKRRHAERDLFSIDAGEATVVCDFRSRSRLHVLRGLERDLFTACDGVRDDRELARSLDASYETVSAAIDSLVRRGFLLRHGSRVLTLAVPLGEYAPSPRVAERFDHLVRQLGRRSRDGFILQLSSEPDSVRLRLDSGSRKTTKRDRGSPVPLSAAQFSLVGHDELVVRDRM